MDGGSNQDNSFIDPTLLDPTLLDPNELNPQLDSNQFNPNQVNPDQLDPDQLDPDQTDPRLVDLDLFDPALFEPNLLDPNSLNPNSLDPTIFQGQDHIYQITAKQQHQHEVQAQPEGTEQQETQLQVDWGSLDNEQQQAVLNISERIGLEFYEMSAEAQHAAIENELAIIRSAANVQFPSFSAQDPGGELLGEQGNYQDIPLSEQQGPPDMGTQFLAETQPGEQPAWYGVVSYVSPL